MSRALPMVRSTRPWLMRLTVSRSSRLLPPPAYVTGTVHQIPSFCTNSSSIPHCNPSLSAAWIRNSEQNGSRLLIESVFIQAGGRVNHGKGKKKPLTLRFAHPHSNPGQIEFATCLWRQPICRLVSGSLDQSPTCLCPRLALVELL